MDNDIVSNVVKSSLKRQLGKVMKMGDLEYLVHNELHHSAVVIGAVGGFAANDNVVFFNRPDNVGTPVVNITGEARESTIDGKPKDGKIYRLKKIGFELRALDGVTDVAMIDQFLRQPLIFTIKIGDDKDYGKPKPVSLASIMQFNIGAPGIAILNLLDCGGIDFGDKSPIFGSGQSLAVEVINKGADYIPTDATPTAHDTILRCYASVDIYRPRSKD